ncbi:MAG: selenium cofactor biosynthesis protein YqeC [Candidatus Neomarinimicrobiota bacterium]
MPFFQILFKDPRLAAGACICLLGGGGKTTLAYQLGRELSEFYEQVLITSLVKAGPSPEIPIQFIGPDTEIDLNPFFKYHNPAYLLKEKLTDQKFQGISVGQLNAFQPQVGLSIVECDGARSRPLKAHNKRDIILPALATIAVILIGAEVINSKIRDGHLHRAELFKQKWNLNDSAVLSIDLITRLVTEKKGYLEKTPHTVEKIYFINKAENYLQNSRNLALSINRKTGSPVFYGSLHQGWWKTIA